jgi:transcriptional regulator with XRE-family HTH domain
MLYIQGKSIDKYEFDLYIRQMLNLASIGEHIAERRKSQGLSQKTLALHAGIGRTTLDALENGRSGELGFTKITKLLAALGLELSIQEGRARRPTFEDLMREGENDQSLDRRR